MTLAPHTTTTPRGSGYERTTTPEVSGTHVVAVAAIALVTVVSVVSWRTGAIFDGGIDGVVVAKAALSALALGGAVATRLLSRARYALGVRSTFLLLLALGVSSSARSPPETWCRAASSPSGSRCSPRSCSYCSPARPGVSC
ncbi:hypothetical protein [Homoserinibacter gongjuensis]|uniref:Uncharacterized protein n=1 Tax=Homoserinibacter gongjuensis TaxID=1162968 RepID=A0ABQ6JZL0_9MICO|nr:hypothetical protein [Homoserinibacter gongjuensis]GMA92793.1 hypothetical protein GCM10025869_33220 [Homoserinibacter gongjuensis]